MLASRNNSIFVYLGKLFSFLAGRVPVTFSGSSDKGKQSPIQSDILAIEHMVTEVQLERMLYERAFETKTSDHVVSADSLSGGPSATSADSISTDTITVKAEFEYRTEVLHWGKVLSDGVTHVSVYTSDGEICDEHSSHHRIAPLRRLKKSVVTTYEGTTLHLSAEVFTLSGNIAHWILDAMGRLMLLEDRLSTPVQVDRYLIPPNQPDYVKCMVDLGIDQNKLLEMPFNEAVQFEKLLCVSNPCGRSSHVTPEWLIQSYRKRFAELLRLGEYKERRIYISRRDANARKAVNEEQLILELESRGFEIIEGSKYSFAEKARLFSEASEVIGLSGAGLIGLLFCRPGARVIEIYPSYFVNYHYASMCSVLGHDHRPFISGCDSIKSKFNPFAGQCDLDIEEFVEFYDALPAHGGSDGQVPAEDRPRLYAQNG